MSLIELLRKHSQTAALSGAVAFGMFSSGCVGPDGMPIDPPPVLFGLGLMGIGAGQGNLGVMAVGSAITDYAAAEAGRTQVNVYPSPGVEYFAGIPGQRQSNGDTVFYFPPDKTFQNNIKRALERTASRNKIPVMQNGGIPDITRIIKHSNGSMTPIYAGINDGPSESQELKSKNKERTETLPAPKPRNSGMNLIMNEVDKELLAQDLSRLPRQSTLLVNCIDLNNDGMLKYGREVRFRDCREFQANSSIQVMMDTHFYGGRKIKKTLYDPQRNIEILIGTEEWEFVERSPGEGARDFVGKMGVAELKQNFAEQAKVTLDGNVPFVFRIYKEGQSEPCEKAEITINFNSLATSP